MKQGFFTLLFACLSLLSAPLYGFSAGESESFTRFSMGYYYLYEGDLPKSRAQFLDALRAVQGPPALLYTMVSEISDMMGDRPTARDYAFRALEIDPDDETALSMTSVFLIAEKEYAKAVEQLERLNRLNPSDLQTLYYLAEAYSGVGQEEKLFGLYEEILAIKPDLVEVRLNLAYLHTTRGNFAKAKAEYKKVLETEPENEKAIFYLTYILLTEGNADEASALFRKLDEKNLLNDEMLEDYASNLFVEGRNPGPVIARIEDKDGVGDVTMGIVLFLDGDYDGAKEYFEKELSRDPGSLAALTGLVRIAEREDNRDMEARWRFVLAGSLYTFRNFERAFEESTKVKEIDPGYLENRYLLGDILLGLGRKADALKEYEYFRDHAQEKGDIHIKLAFLHDDMKQNREAAESFLEAISLQPASDELYYYLGIEYRILEDHEKAVGAFSKAVELNDANAYYHFYLGASLERVGRVEEAIRSLDRSIRLDDRNPASLNYLGYLLADKGMRLDEARTLISKALETDPENGAYLDSMGWVYHKLGEHEKAREYLERAVRYMNAEEEENYLIYDHLGDVYYTVGMEPQALEAWKKALQMKKVEGIRSKIRKLERKMKK